MHNSKIVFLINDSARAVGARYEPHGPVEVFKTLDPSIEVGDMIVVESGTRWDMTTAKVCEVDVDVNLDSDTPVKWVVQKIDSEAFDQIKEKEKAAVDAVQVAERSRKKKELRDSMFKHHEDTLKGLAIADHTEVVEGDTSD